MLANRMMMGAAGVGGDFVAATGGTVTTDGDYKIHTFNSGADFIAMHKNKYWNPQGELLIDAGAFINGIEFASGKEAILIGKPSTHYFKAALESINAKVEEGFFMIGDDIENDVGAAQDIGGKGILIYTGKTKYPLDKIIKIEPDFEAQSLKEVISILNSGV